MPVPAPETSVNYEAILFNGLRVIESSYLEEDGDPVTVRRSMRERFLGLPWRPWVATRIVVPRVPMRGGMVLGGDTILMHPQTMRKLALVLDTLSKEPRTP